MKKLVGMREREGGMCGKRNSNFLISHFVFIITPINLLGARP